MKDGFYKPHISIIANNHTSKNLNYQYNKLKFFTKKIY